MKRISTFHRWVGMLSVASASCLGVTISTAQEYQLSPYFIINAEDREEVRQLVRDYMKGINQGRDDDAMIRAQARTKHRMWKKMTNDGDSYAAWLVARCFAHGIENEKNVHQAYLNYEKSAQRGLSAGKLFLGIYIEQGMGINQSYSEAAYWYRQAAEEGVAVASFRLAILLENKMISSTNPSDAARYFGKAALAGFLPAYVDAGQCYRKGKGVVPDPVEAYQWFRQGAVKGSPEAMYETAFCLRKGEGVEKDIHASFQWFLSSAQGGCVDGMIMTALAYQKGEGVAPDETHAFDWNLKAAHRGRASAMHSVGICYRDGKGTKKDMKQGYHWTSKAAELGDSIAMYDLANSYLLTGQGIDQNDREGAAWLKKSVEKNYRPAMTALAICYLRGIGVDRDESVGFVWAEAGARFSENRDSQFILGLFHEMGWGTLINLEKAFDCYFQSHLAGNALASCKVGAFYQDGRNGRPEATQAVACFKKAADAGCAQGWYLLGLSHHLGLGCEKNSTEGNRCLAKAAEQGMAEALAALKDFEANKNTRFTSPIVADGTDTGSTDKTLLQQNQAPSLLKELDTQAREKIAEVLVAKNISAGNIQLQTTLKTPMNTTLPDDWEKMRSYQQRLSCQFPGLRWAVR